MAHFSRMIEGLSCYIKAVQKQVDMIIEVFIWNKPYRLYRLLGMEIKEKIGRQ
jgi:hypothetical protein